MHFACLANTLLKDEESARDNFLKNQLRFDRIMVMSGPVFFGPLRRSAAIFATVELPSVGGISSCPLPPGVIPPPGGDTL